MAQRTHVLVGLSVAMLTLSPLVVTEKAQAKPVVAAQLSAVRAGAHPGFDRLVFQFSGALPLKRSVTWVSKVTQDGSGKVFDLGGKAFLRVSFQPAVAHTASGQPSWTGAVSSQFDFPVLRSLRLAGDFENVLSFGVGLWEKVPLHVFTLPNPSRVVVDAAVPATGPSQLSEADNGRLVYLKVGESVTVALRTCTSCGESWHASVVPAPRIVRSVGPRVVALPHPAGIVGFPYETQWALTATGRGYAALRLYETGPGRGAPPIASYALRFVVR